MQGPTEIPSNMQSKDKFLIKSVVAVPGDTAENSLKLVIMKQIYAAMQSSLLF